MIRCLALKTYINEVDAKVTFSLNLNHAGMQNAFGVHITAPPLPDFSLGLFILHIRRTMHPGTEARGPVRCQQLPAQTNISQPQELSIPSVLHEQCYSGDPRIQDCVNMWRQLWAYFPWLHGHIHPLEVNKCDGSEETKWPQSKWGWVRSHSCGGGRSMLV